MIKKILIGIGVIIALLLLYLMFWPIPIHPVAAAPLQKMPEMIGDFNQNTVLSEVKLLGEGVCLTPEDVAFDKQERIYSGMVEKGEIMRFQLDGTNPEVFAITDGKPAGLNFDAEGNLIVADVEKGLLSINPDGKITVLVDNFQGEKLYMINDLDIDSDGNIYFSQTSTKYQVDKMFYDIMEHRPNGRLYVYSPETRETKLLVEELYFANGVAVSADSSYVLVAETNAYRISRYWLKGAQKGEKDVFIDNLPGLPDNIDFNGTDTYWLAIVDGPEQRKTLDSLLPHPFLKKIIARIPTFITQPNSSGGYAFVLGVNLDGLITYNLQDPKGEKYNNITSVTEYKGMLYFGTNNHALTGIGRIPISEME